jgi:hypothetical protein
MRAGKSLTVSFADVHRLKRLVRDRNASQILIGYAAAR